MTLRPVPGVGEGGVRQSPWRLAAQARREAAGGDDADHCGRRRRRSRRLRGPARLPASFRPTRLRAGPLVQFASMRAAPGKPPSSRRRFWIDQGEAGLDRRRSSRRCRGRRAEAGLEPQRIAGAQADRLDPLVGEQRRPRRAPRHRRARDLVAVLAGVAGARDDERRRRRPASRRRP